MSVQILFQGKLLGIEDFLTQPETLSDASAAARSLWVSLVSEVIPRALLAEFELARVLLGSSGGGQFLLVLPDAIRAQAEEFLARAAQQITAATNGHVRLIWAVTENLGDWTVVRKRLQDEMARKQAAPLSGLSELARLFEPAAASEAGEGLFTVDLVNTLRNAQRIGWSPDLPEVITTGDAKHAWLLSAHLSLDGITLARHTAMNEDESAPASPLELASRAQGRPAWGVLRGDVDLFSLRLRRLQSIEEYVQLSSLYKQFFAGELEVLSMQGEFWRRVTILYSGGDDFAVYGSWDALVLFAIELEKTFHRFAEENLADFPGAEAKTITMALAIAGTEDTLAHTFEQAGKDLATAKASDKDCIYLFDRVVEWKQLTLAGELKEAVSRVSDEFKAAGRQFVTDLTRLYAKASAAAESMTDHERLLRRAHRFQRRYSRAAYSKREKEFQKLRSHLIGEIVGRNIRPGAGRQLRLRPAGVVALEWARLSKEV
jgi:CRISPR-associated protein Csm1